MKRLVRFLVVVALAASSNSVLAEWIKVATDQEGTTYVDPQRIVEGNLVKVWQMRDEIKPVQLGEAKPFLSSKTLWQYDCTGRRSRLMANYGFAGSMGRGGAIYSRADVNSPWADIIPDTLGSTILDSTACRK